MDKKTVKVIEKYSMLFVQLVLEKGEEDRIFSDLTQIKQVVEKTGLPSFLKQVAVDESDKEKQLLFSKILCRLYYKTLSRFWPTITEQIFFMMCL
ncbi:ATP synthase delta chain [Streptococcus pneumoniae 2071004]|nr:ATP synthase delta chain [Streptococcus pneumoniae 2071004]